MRTAALLVLGFLGACGRPSPREAATAGLVQSYAAGLRLGEPIRTSRRKHPALALAPGLGYRDSSYQSADGFGDLVVVLEGMPATATVSPSQGTRSLAIQLSSTSEESARAAEARLRGALGPPQEGCRETISEGPSRTLFWRHEHGGAAFMIPVGPWRVNVQDAQGKKLGVKLRPAVLVFTRLDPATFLTSRQRCPPIAPPPSRRHR